MCIRAGASASGPSQSPVARHAKSFTWTIPPGSPTVTGSRCAVTHCSSLWSLGRRTAGWLTCSSFPLAFSQHLHDHPFPPLPVPLAVEHPLPRPQVQLAFGDRDDDLVANGETAKVRRGVVLPGL